jgi:glycosyltransferase involved in cell wall biosynthesis
MAEPFLTVVVPAFNEGARLGHALESIRSYLTAKSFTAELIVVDDGSRDETPELLAACARDFPSLRVLRNERNRGKGYTVRRGVLAAQGALVAFADADLSAPIEELDKLLLALESAGADAAVGSRALKRELIGVHQPWFRELGGRLFNLLVRLFTGLKVRDTQCGLKLFRRAATRRAFEQQRVEGFGFDPELLFLIERFGGKVVEVPVRWNDNPATKVHFLRDATRMALELVLLRWRWWRGHYRQTPPATA